MKSMRFMAFWGTVLLMCSLLIPQSMAEDWLYTVRKGDTIWGLSHKYLKDPMRFQEIQKYNNVRLDRSIPPGTTLKFPMEYLKFAPTEVEVTAVNGVAHLIRRQEKEVLTLEHKLILDDTITTQQDSSVALLFADGSELLLGENSELVFDVQTKWGETGMVDSRMRLMKGSAEGRVKPLIGPGANFEVHTPSAVATVRGTEFRVRVDEQDSGVIFNEVDEGNVAVALNKDLALVKQGFGLKTSKDAPLKKPKPLLPAPDFVNPLEQYPGHPVTLAWQPVDGAQSYQFELFEDAEMTQMVHKANIKEPQLQLPQVELGSYSVRVRAVDNEGLQGLNSAWRFTILPVPASPQTAMAGQEYRAGDALNISWQAVNEAEQYRWLLAKDKQFRSVVEEKVLTDTAVSLQQGLPQGTYYWKVAAGNDNGYGTFSKPIRFETRLPEPPAIQELDDEMDSDQTLRVTWQPVELATAYQWQVSTDPDFRSILEQGDGPQTHFSLDGLPEQQLYIRVAADGPYNKNRFSEVVSIEVVEPSDGKTAFSIGSVLLFILLL